MNGRQHDNMAYAFASQNDKDAARRMHEAVALHLTAGRLSDVFESVVGKWCAFRLSDGTGGNDKFDSKDEALRHTSPYEKDYCYLKITPDGISPEDAWRFLRINRHPMIDTTAPEHVHSPDIFPHMSNLSPAAREAVRREAERNASGN